MSAALPIRVAQAIGAMLGAAAARLPNRRRDTVRTNLAICLPELDLAHRRHLLRRNLVETGRSLFELGAIWGRPPEQLAALTEEVQGGKVYREELNKGKGVILLAPHIGNWEFMNYFLMLHEPAVVLYRAPRIRELDPFMRGARERTGITLVPATTGGVRQLYKALGDGRPLLILPDQEPLRSAGEFAPFFGVPALTMTLVNRLLRKSGATTFFGHAQRSPRGRFTIRIERAPEGLDDADPTIALARLNLGVERCVRSCPEQYLWSYKRFKSRPEGELSPYVTGSLPAAKGERLDPIIEQRLRADRP